MPLKRAPYEWFLPETRNLLAHLLRTRVRLMSVSAAILGTSATLLYVGFRELDAGLRERISDSRILQPDASEATRSIVRPLADTVYSAMTTELWDVGVYALVGMAAFFLLMDAVMLAVAFTTEMWLLPRAQWVWEYRQRRETAERIVTRPLVAITVVVIALACVAGQSTLRSQISMERLIALTQNGILVVAALTLAIECWIDIRFGFLDYLSVNRGLRFLQLLRVLSMRSIQTLALLVLFFVAVLAIQHWLIPVVVARTETTERIIASALEAAERAADSAPADTARLNDIFNEVRSFMERNRTWARALPAEVVRGLDSLVQPMLAVVALILFTSLFIPLIYCEVRAPIIATLVVIAALVALDLLVRGFVPSVFRIAHRGPTAVIGIAALVAVAGETMTHIIMRLLRKTRICWKCHMENEPTSLYCGQCRAPLGIVDVSESPSLLGNDRTRHVHRRQCPYLRGVNARNLTTIRDLAQAETQKYVACRRCLADEARGDSVRPGGAQ